MEGNVFNAKTKWSTVFSLKNVNLVPIKSTTTLTYTLAHYILISLSQCQLYLGLQVEISHSIMITSLNCLGNIQVLAFVP